MTGPQAEMAAGMMAYGHLRTSDTDREQVIDVLKAAFVQGGLTRAEFDALVGHALAARTYADLAAAIPAGLAGAQAPQQAVRKFLSSGVRSSAGAIALAAASWLATLITDNAALFMVAVVVTVCVFLTSPIANSLILDSAGKKHSGAQLPPPPAPTPKFMRGPS